MEIVMNDELEQAMEDVIGAFVDGEAVDPAQLELALAQPKGRAWLIDLLVLRGLVAGQPASRPAVRDAPVNRLRSRATWLTLAASIAVVGVVGGYAMGFRSAARQSAPDAEMAVTVPAAPAPTHVIRLESGVDWTERGGGN
jgi:hypothetical protein